MSNLFKWRSLIWSMLHLVKENLENCKADDVISKVLTNLSTPQSTNTVELGDKELSDKEQIGVKEPFSVIK